MEDRGKPRIKMFLTLLKKFKSCRVFLWEICLCSVENGSMSLRGHKSFFKSVPILGTQAFEKTCARQWQSLEWMFFWTIISELRQIKELLLFWITKGYHSAEKSAWNRQKCVKGKGKVIWPVRNLLTFTGACQFTLISCPNGICSWTSFIVGASSPQICKQLQVLHM